MFEWNYWLPIWVALIVLGGILGGIAHFLNDTYHVF